MQQLSLEQTETLKKIVLGFIQGNIPSVTKIQLQTLTAELKTSAKKLYQSISLDFSTPDPFLTAILRSINLYQEDHRDADTRLQKYSPNLYELLKNLYHDGNHQLGYLLKLIENTKPATNWTALFLVGSITSAGLGVLAYFKRAYIDQFLQWLEQSYPMLLEWTTKTFSILRNLSLLGILYTGLGLLWSWIYTFSNGTTSVHHKITALFFKTTAAILSMAAYAVAYLAAGVMSLTAASLFFLSSTIELVKSLYFYIKASNNLTQLSQPDLNTATWETLAQYKRAENLYQRSLRTFWIKLTAALFTCVAVAIWSFFPPSLIITASCFIFISLIALTKRSIVSSMHEASAFQLQHALRHLGKKPSEALRPRDHQILESLKARETLIADRARQLSEEENNLRQREAMISTEVTAVKRISSDLTRTMRDIGLYREKPCQVDQSTMTEPAASNEPTMAQAPNNDESVTPSNELSSKTM